MCKSHNISLDKAHTRSKGTTEEVERKLRLRIEGQKEKDRLIARIKRNFYQPVTKPFYTNNLGKQECTT